MLNTGSTTAIDPQAWAALQQKYAQLEKENAALKVQGIIDVSPEVEKLKHEKKLLEECQKLLAQQSIAVATLYKDVIQKNCELENLVKKMQSTDEKELRTLNEALASRDLEIRSLKQVNIVLEKNLSEKEIIHARILSSEMKKTEELDKKLKSVEAKANLFQSAFDNFDKVTEETLKKRAAISWLGPFIENTRKGQKYTDFNDAEFAQFKEVAYECSQITALRQEVLTTRRKEITL